LAELIDSFRRLAERAAQAVRRAHRSRGPAGDQVVNDT
jgi:hypothetical protein